MKKIPYLCGASLVFLTACAPPKTAAINELDATKSSLTQSDITDIKSTDLSQTTEVSKRSQNTTASTIPKTFRLSGAIAAKSHQKGWTAMVDWQQSGPHSYQMTLMGPMGSQAVRIQEQQGLVTYQEGAKKFSAKNGDDLLAKKTGIHLPVHNLYYWIRGIPAPGAIQSATRDSNGQLKILKQSGYTVEFNEYTNTQQHMLPRKLRLYGKDVVVKLVIKRWSV